VEHFQQVKVNSKYLKYRPNVSVSKDKRAWWKYAITAMLKEEVQRRTRMWAWSHLKRHRWARVGACEGHVVSVSWFVCLFVCFLQGAVCALPREVV